jgi:S-adenosylmethionine decarboxylase
VGNTYYSSYRSLCELELGRHALAHISRADFNSLNDSTRLLKAFERTVSHFSLEALYEPQIHQFEPQGLTGIVLLAESHISIHTWPERGEAAVDVFTCGGRDSRQIAEFFCTAIDNAHLDITVVER